MCACLNTQTFTQENRGELILSGLKYVHVLRSGLIVLGSASDTNTIWGKLRIVTWYCFRLSVVTGRWLRS